SGFEVTHATGVLVFPGRHADESLERPLQVRDAESRVLRELRERHGALAVRVEVLHGALDRTPTRGIAPLAARIAAPARAIASELGVVGSGEERHILADWAPRRT